MFWNVFGILHMPIDSSVDTHYPVLRKLHTVKKVQTTFLPDRDCLFFIQTPIICFFFQKTYPC